MYESNPAKRREVEKVLRKLGWHPEKKGPHVIWYASDGKRTVLVSGHGSRDLPLGTFKSILKRIGITEQRFNEIK